MVSDGELIGAIVGRTGKFLIEVLQVGNVFMTEWGEQLQLDHRGHDVVGRHYHVVERYPAALDFGEHALRILVNIQRHFAAELLFKLLNDLRVDVFAPDEKVELV